MKEPAYDDGWGKLYIGTALDVLRAMPAQSVHMAVTSPPYWGLRSYLPSEHPSKGQEIGTEKTPQEFVEKLVEVFGELWRVLRDDGTLWVNIGDSYFGSWGNYAPGGIKGEQRPRSEEGKRWERDAYKDKTDWRPPTSYKHPTLKNKDLCMVPARLAIALQDAGWYLRQEIVWAKDSAMPESVKDRCTRSHEMVYMLTKRPVYFYDKEAIAEPSATPGDTRHLRTDNTQAFGRNGDDSRLRTGNPTGPTRNARSVWRINPKPYPGSHFATFPVDLPIRCIRAGTSERGVCSECGAPWRRVVAKETTKEGEGYESRMERWGDEFTPAQQGGRTFKVPIRYNLSQSSSRTVGWEPTCTHDADTIPATVLDPFAGSGTTLMAAAGLSRRSIGIDLDVKSAILTAERMGQPWLAPKEEGEPVALEEGRLF